MWRSTHEGLDPFHIFAREVLASTMTPRVSVIIPTYGRPESLRLAVRSVYDQTTFTPESVEIIVVDDHSPTPVELPDFPHVQVIRHATNMGAAGARNTGVEHANANLIAFLDSDDVWLPEKLNRQIELFEQLAEIHEPSKLAVGTGYFSRSQRNGKIMSRRPVSADNVNMFASGCWFCPGSALLISKASFDLVGKQDTELRRLEDLDWFIRFGLAGGKFFCTSSDDVIIRPSGSADLSAVLTAAARLESKFGVSGRFPLSATARNRLAAYLSLERAVGNLAGKRYMSALFHAALSVARRPRLRPSIENFWHESQRVPEDIQHRLSQVSGAPE